MQDAVPPDYIVLACVEHPIVIKFDACRASRDEALKSNGHSAGLGREVFNYTLCEVQIHIRT